MRLARRVLMTVLFVLVAVGTLALPSGAEQPGYVYDASAFDYDGSVQNVLSSEYPVVTPAAQTADFSAGASSHLRQLFGLVAPSTATMSGGVGRPAVSHHPRGSVQIGRDADTVAFATRADVPEGSLAVAVHGNRGGWAPGAVTQDVVDATRKHPDYSPGQSVCLFSCHAGSNGTAAELAELLGAKVRAPTSAVHLPPGGTVPYLDQGGIWRTFPEAR